MHRTRPPARTRARSTHALSRQLEALEDRTVPTVLTFEGATAGYYSPLTTYGNLTWTGFAALNNSPTLDGLDGGYNTGAVSGTTVAFNGGSADYGQPGEITSQTPFTFNSVYLTAAYNQGLQVVVEGWGAGQLLYTTSLTLGPTAPTFHEFDYVGIDDLRFYSWGGTQAAYFGHGYGDYVVLDNLTYTGSPAPGLVASPLVGVSESTLGVLSDTAVVGQTLTYILTPRDPTPADQAGTFSYAIDWDGNGIIDQTVSGPAGLTVTHTYAAAGSYAVRVHATDQDGLVIPTSTPLTMTVANLTSAGVQDVVSSALPIDPGTGNPTLTLQGGTQAQADAVVALFQSPGTPGFTPLQPPAGATTPIDIVVTTSLDVQFHEANFSIPAGIRVQINGGTWIGGSPAMTISSGDLTITGATFVNATNAPTILVTGGNLTLRNDTIQESTGFAAAAISVTGGAVDLGTTADPGGNILNVNGTGKLIQNTGTNSVSADGNTFEQNGIALTSPYRIQDLIVSSVNSAGAGPVTFGGGDDTVYVTQTSGMQFGIDAVASGGTVYVEAGHYGGTYTVGLKLLTINFQGGPSVSLTPDPLSPDLTDLIVSGTGGNDAFKFNPGGPGNSVEADVGQWPKGRFGPTGRIVAYGGAGDDDIQVAGGINISAWLYGGDGNDRLKGGNGNNVLIGGAGDDLLVGGSNRDILIGGTGADRIVGNEADDVLIAGTTAFDGNESALWALLNEWTSSRSYSTRVANLMGTGGGTDFDNRLNENIFLQASGANVTVFDDTSADVLTGSSGQDWFFANLLGSGVRDKITDLSSSEFANDLIFIQGP